MAGTTTQPVEVTIEGAVALPRKAWRHTVKAFIVNQPLGAFGLLVFIMLILVAAFAPVIATHDPIANNVRNQFTAPNRTYYFGTDQLGRDLFSRIVYGARTSLYVGIFTVAIGTTTGAAIGVISAYYARWDMIIQRFVDAMLAIPNLLLALAIVSVIGPSLRNTIIAIGVGLIPGAARVLRSQALAIQQRPFVLAARSIGAGDVRILLRHIAPNCFAPYIILASNGLAFAIIAEATLSFLGLGTPPPRPSWGAMLSGSVQNYIAIAPWLAIFPGLAITVVALGFSLFGDAVRDVLDPRLRGSS
ncbi:MAG: ABC transporter permease [Dehalococcoidia bacterium]